MQYELDEKYEDYHSAPHEEWHDFLSTMEEKYNINRAAAEIKRLAASKSAPANYDIDTYTNIPYKKKVINGILPAHKQQGNKNPNHKGSQS